MSDDDKTAAEVRRLRLFLMAAAAIVLVVVMWNVLDDADQSAEDNAERLVECIAEGGTADECE